LPPNGFDVKDLGYQKPVDDGGNIKVEINPSSERLQKLSPFEKWDGEDLKNLKLLIKAKGKCTTDHISMAGPWLKFRGHLENISKNLLIGATNAFNNKVNYVKNQITKDYDTTPSVANYYRLNNISSLIVGDENYGEGSSREHAAMEPRFMGVRVVLVKSFARIHETNLKKQGILALTFDNKNDYDKIKENSSYNILDLENFKPNNPLEIEIVHENFSEKIIVNHTYNQNQIEWFKAGSSLNLISEMNG